MYQSMILKVPNLFTTKCAYASISSHTAQCLVSYQGECELSKLCWNNGFLVRWLYIVITCDAWASTFSPYHDSLALQNELLHRGIYQCIMKQVCFIPLCKQFFHTYGFWIFFLVSHTILGFQYERLFWILSMYSATLSMAMISMGTASILRSRRVYAICFLTWKKFESKCFWIFSNPFQVHLEILPPYTSTL